MMTVMHSQKSGVYPKALLNLVFYIPVRAVSLFSFFSRSSDSHVGAGHTYALATHTKRNTSSVGLRIYSTADNRRM